MLWGSDREVRMAPLAFPLMFPSLDVTAPCPPPRYPSVACEILTSDVPQINDALGADETLLNRLYGFLQSSGCLNPLLASFFSKVMGILINRKTDQVPPSGVPLRVGGRLPAPPSDMAVPAARVLPAEEGGLRGPAAAAHRHLGHHGPAAAAPHLRGAAPAAAGSGQCELRGAAGWPGGEGPGSGPVSRARLLSHPKWLNEEKIVQRLIEQIHPSKDDNVSVSDTPGPSLQRGIEEKRRRWEPCAHLPTP